MMMFAMRSSFVSHHHPHNHLPTTTTKRTLRKTRECCRSPSASNDDLNSNNIEHDDDDFDDEWHRDVELNVQLVSPETTKNRRVITIQEQRHDDAVIPVMAKPPLAFLLGMFCAMPIALWEAKRKVRLDARIYGGLDGGSSPATDARASRGPPPPKASPTRTGGEGGGTSASSSSPSSPSTTPAGPGKRALKASTVAALARVNPEMYLPTPKERSYGNQSMTTTTTTGSNAASNEGIVERKGGRESKVAFSRLVDGARSVIASAGISSTLPTVVMEDIGEENEDVDGMRVNAINSNGTSSSNGRSRRTSRTLIAVKWNPPEHDPFATILVGGNIEQLGSWTPENCVHMKNIGGNKWIADLGHIAAATEINFKFVVESENFGRRAETGEVRNFDVPVLRGGETRFTYVARQAPRW